jgi:hypothetical protein
MLFFLSCLFLSMFIYLNTLFYSLVLLIIVLTLLYVLVSNLILNTLTIIMLAIVYIGAIIILIGYICAICPNLILAPSNLNIPLYLLLLLFILSIIPFVIVPSFTSVLSPIVTYFYNSSGFIIFITLIFILFITLLIVTSQYMVPKGPFRSVSI